MAADRCEPPPTPHDTVHIARRGLQDLRFGSTDLGAADCAMLWALHDSALPADAKYRLAKAGCVHPPLFMRRIAVAVACHEQYDSTTDSRFELISRKARPITNT